MKSRKTAGVLVLSAALALTGWVFYRTIWTPLYADRETSRFVEEQGQPILQVDVDRENGKQHQSWSIADPQALSKLRAGLQHAEYSSRAEPPKVEERYHLKIRRSDSRVDEYDVVLETAGQDRESLYVIRRSGGNSTTGSASNTPELRSVLQQVLKAPPR